MEKQVSRTEQEIEILEKHIKARGVELAKPELYQDFSRWNELHLEHERWKNDLEILTNKWSDLSSQLESKKQEMEQVG